MGGKDDSRQGWLKTIGCQCRVDMVSSPPPPPLRDGGGEIFFRKLNFVGGSLYGGATINYGVKGGHVLSKRQKFKDSTLQNGILGQSKKTLTEGFICSIEKFEKFVLTYKFIFCESFISFIIIVVVLRLLLLNTLIRTP